MDKLEIAVREDKTTFEPGQTVEGAIRWNLPTGPKHLDLALFWYTAGKGTRDVGVVETLKFDSPGAFGSKDFAFTLSDGPYSFSGKLISLIWALEITCSPGSETIRREIIVSPTGQEITFGEVPSQGRLSLDGNGARHPWERLLSSRR